MSVSVLLDCHINPIFREPGKLPIKSPELLARYHARGQATGDASGGTLAIVFNLGLAAGDLFAPFGLFVIDSFAYTTSVAPSYVSFTANLGERTSFGNLYLPFYLGNSTNLDLNRSPRVNGYHRLSGLPSATQFLFVRDNVNGVLFEANILGRIFDERML